MNPIPSIHMDRNEVNPYPTAHLIREIGRGAKGARSLSRADAAQLYAAMLDGRVADLELGAILIAMRIKGESLEELAGFSEAAEASFALLEAPTGSYRPIVIPSYNGARRAANLTPLLAMLLAREGAPVLVHGVLRDATRVTSAEIFAQLGVQASTRHDVQQQWQRGVPVLMDIDNLAPKLSRLLALRKVIGVRNSTHTLVKILQPFEQAALRLTSYTHPEYASLLGEFFTNPENTQRGDVMLMRATEGETVANTKKVQQIDWFHAGQKTTLVASQPGADDVLAIPANAEGSAAWIKRVLNGNEAVPDNIAVQVRHCLDVAKLN